MRKYLQITIVLSSFFVLVFLRNLRGTQDEGRPVVNQIAPTSIPTQSSQSESQAQSSPQPQNSMQMTIPAKGSYKDGVYTGTVEDAYYGYIQVQVSISNGLISDVTFLQYPNDNSTSRFINSQAMPMLKQEAIQAQSTQVDIVSGASDSSMAFQKSLRNALASAK